MAFTYTPGTPDDITRIRYHIGDADEASAIYSDEELQFVLDEEGSLGAAVVSLIENILVKLSHEPDMTADWLRVDWRRSAENWRWLLSEKRRKFGLGAQVLGRGQHVYRKDSLQQETPTYDRRLGDDWDDCP